MFSINIIKIMDVIMMTISNSFWGVSPRPVLAEMPNDLLWEICACCMWSIDPTCAMSLLCTNRRFYQVLGGRPEIKEFFSLLKKNFKEICPKLSILHLKEMGFETHVEPPFPNKYAVVKIYQKMVSCTESGAGVTLMCQPKDVSLISLKGMERECGIEVFEGVGFGNRNTYSIRQVSAYETRWVMMTDNVLQGSRGQTVDVQAELVSDGGWEVPTCLELVFLCCGTKIVYNRYLYRCGPDPRDPGTVSRSSTEVCGSPINVGSFTPRGGEDGIDRLYLTFSYTFNPPCCGVSAVYRFPLPDDDSDS
jgi:hypothetical protein